MNESILKALMRLFAIIANVNQERLTSDAREIVKSYLILHLSNELLVEYVDLFDKYTADLDRRKVKGERKQQKRTSLNSVKVLRICNEINEQLEQKEKIIVLVRLFEFIGSDTKITEKELDFIKTVSDVFNISDEEYADIKSLIIDGVEQIKEQRKLLIISNKKRVEYECKHLQIYDKHVDGNINILHVESTNIYFVRYNGQQSIYINALNIIPGRTYVFESGSVIKGHRINPIYYTDVARRYILEESADRVVLTAKDIEFRFKNSENGIHKFSFSEESGNMLGIMGGSGVGKSTLLNVLNGNLKLNSGEITINGYDLYKDKEKLNGVIGYVPQDDLLIEELTVFQNLYYNAKLCFSNFTEDEIQKVVHKILIDLDLLETQELTVGNSLNKFISGGQRKRLNIALELMREPSILIVDEPTSGLSSQDSEIVMSLLKEQTLKGKLVLVNIHQPSSDIFKLFDKLLILDKGGYPVYYGYPIDSVVYFKMESLHVNASERECILCGNVNPELPLQILESKMVNEYGKFTRVRKITPEEWYRRFKEHIQPNVKIPEVQEKTPLPKNKFKIPTKFRQLRIFSERNLLSKLSNRQYLLINFTESPILALILGYFTKYVSGTVNNPNAYIFMENDNIPAYLFMCVIVALFIGLTVSAEEIIRDRKILNRESFLNLSWFSYLNSKIVILFAISIIQSLSFILVGNYILGIKWLNFNYFIIFFSTMAAANLIGLNISSALNSVVTIYITIPFILVPQLLFSGVIVDYSKLHKHVISEKYVPVIGDLMISRWSYEAFAVNQFKNNEFEKHFFKIDQEISSHTFQSMFKLQELQHRVNECIIAVNKHKQDTKKFENDLKLIRNEFAQFQKLLPKRKFSENDKLNSTDFNKEVGDLANEYIDKLKQYYRTRTYLANKKKDEIFQELSTELGADSLVRKMKNDYYNNKLAEFVLSKNEMKKIVETSDHILFRKKDPIFHKAQHQLGRAHFYAPEKRFLNYTIDTVWFNLAIIWLATFVMYIMLIFNVLRKIIDSVSRCSFSRLGFRSELFRH